MTTDGNVQVQSSPPQDWTQEPAPPSVNPPSPGVDVQGGLDPRAAAKSDDKPVRARTVRRPPWWTNRPLLAAVILGALVAELAAYALLGVIWWAVANLAVATVVFFGALAWRRKGKGGVLDRFLSVLGRSRRGGGSRTGGKGGGRYPGRQGSTSGGSAGKAGGRLAALRSKLPRVLGGTRGRTSGSKGAAGTGSKTGTSGGRSGRKFRMPGLGRNRKSGTGTSGSGSSGTGSSDRKFRLPWRRNRGGSSGTQTGRKGSTSGGSSSGTPGRNFRPPWRRNKTTGSKPPAERPAPPPTGSRPAGTKPSPGPTSSRPNPGGREQRPPQKPPGQPKPDQKKNTGKPGGGEDMTEPVPYSDDQSLQRYGSNLAKIEEAADEVRAAYAAAEAKAARLAAVLGRIKDQGDSDLPLSTRVQSEMENIHKQATTARSSDEWGRIAADASTLPAQYRQEHETDEDRLHAPRKSRAAEMRADVTTASQDN